MATTENLEKARRIISAMKADINLLESQTASSAFDADLEDTLSELDAYWQLVKSPATSHL